MRVYLDNCCFNRPFDDQEHLSIQLETEAKLFVQQMVYLKHMELVWSFILDYENEMNPFPERKERIAQWQALSTINVEFSDLIVTQAEKLLELGIKEKDALHVVCAIHAKAEVFLTTDKKLLNKSVEGIELLNPIDFVRRLD